MDGMSEHTSENCPDCGHAPGERSNGTEGEDLGCDKIANPFLSDKEDSHFYGGIYMNSQEYAGENTSPIYGNSSSRTRSSAFGYVDGGSVFDGKYAQNKAQYAQSGDGEACMNPEYENYHSHPSTSSQKTCNLGKKSRKTMPLPCYQTEDEMTLEAKRWITKYSELKKRTDLEREFIMEYIENSTKELRQSFKEISEELLQIVHEKVSELESKIESNNK